MKRFSILLEALPPDLRTRGTPLVNPTPPSRAWGLKFKEANPFGRGLESKAVQGWYC
jgi:hypothetical protein